MAPKLILAAAVSLLTGPALGLQDASFGSSEPPPTDPWAVSPAPGSADADPWIAFALRALDAHGDDARPALRFLDEHRPASDADLDADLLFNNLDLALRARAEFPWAADVPEEMFLNDVLPYAVFDETREDWRTDLYDRCRSIVADARTAAEAIQALNRELFNEINVHYNTGRKAPNQSLSESIAQGRATCTGLSIILVNACRAVGIPARAVGVASWHDKRGNHTWVEAWDGQRWRFMGADEYDRNGLDRGWFTGDARKAVAGSEEHAVWATSWKPTGHHFPLVWDRADTSVHAVDVTARYAPQTKKEETGDKTQTVYFRVFDTRDGERIEATIVALPTPGRPVIIKTNAGTTDLNDMPSLTVSRGEPFSVMVMVGDESRNALIEPVPGASRTVDLMWDKLAEPALSRDEAESLIGMAFEAREARIAAERQPEIDANAFTLGDHTLKILEKTFGDEPDSGRSLWISMHGGGGAPAEVNDQQWQNQIKLYQPEEGIYIAPRAPTDTWNLWHQAHIDDLFDRLIETYIATRNVNPDKVYLMGYSAGGDGVFQLAPRMADRFAAAAMMAGHPNETTPDGLRNLPFALFMGGKDGAYNRNTVAEQWGERLAELAESDPGGYPHLVRIYPDHGHWMNGDDKEALPWMAEHVRHAWPKKVVWKQDDVTHTRFYWLGVEKDDATPRAVITAEVDAQTIDVAAEDLTAVTLYLRDALLDLDLPVLVRVNGETVYSGAVPRTRAAIERSLTGRADPVLAATAILDLSW